MSYSETITKESLTNILNEVLPQSRPEPLADYIVEQGASGDWTYRKWNSGIVECWRLVSISSMSWSAYITGLYYGNVSFSFPFAISNPLIYANIRRVSSNVGWVANINYSSSTSFSLTIVRNGNSGDVTAQVYVKGKWK